MQKIVFGLSLILFLAVNVTAVDVADFRKVFHAAVLDKEKIGDFNSFMRKVNPDNPVTLAYLAVSEAMLADIKWSPFEKYDQVKKYQSLILSALSKDPNNLEIRFLRYCVEYHIPSWLGFESHLIEDKNFIVNNLGNVSGLDFDPYFVRYIGNFMKDTGLCSAAELQQIDQILKSKYPNVVN